LSICGLSLPSINYNYLCQISIKQRNQHVCLIWRKTCSSINDFSTVVRPSPTTMKLSCLCSLIGKSLGQGASVDVKMNFLFQSWCLHIFLMILLYLHNTQYSCATVYYSNTSFRTSMFNSYQEQLEMDTETCRLWYSKENV
jgi:hypothetical protein